MDTQQLIQHLKALKLHAMANHLGEVTSLAQTSEMSREAFLYELTQREVQQRTEQKVKRLLQKSKSPVPKLLSSYSLENRKGITQMDLDNLVKGDWVRKGHNVVLYGNIGVGKTHIALGVTRALCQQGMRCLFTTAAQMMTSLLEAKKEMSLGKKERDLDKFDLIVFDEVGFVSATDEGAELFFQLIANRYERKSSLFTTNLAFSQWEKVFQKPLVTQAALDRILHHCKTFHILGPSYRGQQAKQAMESLTP